MTTHNELPGLDGGITDEYYHLSSANATKVGNLPTLGTANQILGVNSGATSVENKTLAVGTAGTDFAITHTANTVTFNIPDASATARGVVTTGTQTFAGAKTFSGILTASNTTDSTSITTGSLVTAGGLGVAKNLNVGGTTNGNYQNISVNQTTHGFSQLNVIYNNAGTWTKALATSRNTLAIGIVTEVVDANNFKFVSVGQVSIPSHGLVVGDYYTLSAITAGLLVQNETEYIGNYHSNIVHVLDANTLLVLPSIGTDAITRNNDTQLISIDNTDTPYDILEIDEMINADATSGAIVVNALTPEAKYDGVTFTIKKIDSSANTVTIKSSSGNIDGTLGTTGIVISVQYDSITIVCDGTNYWIK